MMPLILDLSGGALMFAGIVLMALPYIAAGTTTLDRPMRRPAHFFVALGFAVMLLGGALLSI